MFKSTDEIKYLNPNTEKEIKALVPDAVLVMVLDKENEITPLAFKVPKEMGDTEFIDRKEAKKRCMVSTFTDLPKSMSFSFGSGSSWCLVDVGGGRLVWVWRP